MNREQFESFHNWVIRVTPQNEQKLTAFKKSFGNERDSARTYEFVNRFGWGYGSQERIQLITDEQFLEFVLKIEPIKKEIEQFPFFKILTQNRSGSILSVQNNEGNIFILGDVVKALTLHSDQFKNIKITAFRKSKDGLNICAQSNTIGKWGIGIDKIEHIVEIKEDLLAKSIKNFKDVESKHAERIGKEETLLEKAKRLYPKGVVFRRIVGFKGGSFHKSNGNVHICEYQKEFAIFADNVVIYTKNKWAPIIEKI